MNLARLFVSAVVAAAVDLVYGFVVYGNMLSAQFGRFPAVFRSAETQTAYLPVMAVGILLGMLAIAYVYAKGYEGQGLVEGARFGVLIGVFNAGYVIAVDYAILNIGRRLTLSMMLAGLVEWIVVGLAIAAVYRPASVGSARAAARASV
jgi:hypothetical protein